MYSAEYEEAKKKFNNRLCNVFLDLGILFLDLGIPYIRAL